MADAGRVRAKYVALFAILILSAATMLWLVWHFPVITGLATLAILAILGVCARLSKLTDTDLTELAHGSDLHGDPRL